MGLDEVVGGGALGPPAAFTVGTNPKNIGKKTVSAAMPNANLFRVFILVSLFRLTIP